MVNTYVYIFFHSNFQFICAYLDRPRHRVEAWIIGQTSDPCFFFVLGGVLILGPFWPCSLSLGHFWAPPGGGPPKYSPELVRIDVFVSHSASIGLPQEGVHPSSGLDRHPQVRPPGFTSWCLWVFWPQELGVFHPEITGERCGKRANWWKLGVSRNPRQVFNKTRPKWCIKNPTILRYSGLR